MSQQEQKLIPFSVVLVGLEAGKKYARAGWNGKNLYIQAHGSVIATSVNPSEDSGLDRLYLERFLVIVNGERVNTWVPSISDLFGKDWYEVI